MKKVIKFTELEEIEFVNLTWNEVYRFAIGIDYIHQILIEKQKSNPNDTTLNLEVERFKNILDTINQNYPEWKSNAIGILDELINS